MMKRLVLVAATVVLLAACSDDKKPAPPPDPAPAQEPAFPAEEGPRPPAPPLVETFDRAPQLSLFARIGDFRPEEDDEVRLPFWRTYIEHLLQTSGVVKADPVSGNLDILVVGDKAGSKFKKAQKLGTVEILSEKDFFKILEK